MLFTSYDNICHIWKCTYITFVYGKPGLESHMHPVSIVKRCFVFVVTRAVAVVIFVPPEAPTTILTLWCLSNIIVGLIDESGLLPCQKTKVIC